MKSQHPNQGASLESGVELLTQLLAGHTLDTIRGESQEEQEALYTLAYSMYVQARYVEAMRVFALLLTRNHMDRRYHMAFGACLQMQGRLEEAIKYYGIASTLDLCDPEAPFQAAQCLLGLGRKEEAHQALHYARCLTQAEAKHAELAARIAAMLEILDRGHQSGGAANS